MPRITKDVLEFCVNSKKCCDCYIEEKDVEEKDTKAIVSQRRGKVRVPCCPKHFEDYAAKMKQARALKYARHCERRQEAGLCTHHGCDAKLIPREILPPWARELTCGQHSKFKAFQINRISVIRYIMDHSLTPSQRETAMLQNVIYKPVEGWVFIGIQYPNCYVTGAGSASNLERRIMEIRSQKSSTLARSGAARTNKA